MVPARESHSRGRYPLRELTRSSVRAPYGAPHSASASALIRASMNLLSMERNKSGSARSRCSDKNRAGSILWFAVIALISFRLTLSCLLKDQAVAASRHDATLKNGAPSYTTSVDSTAATSSRCCTTIADPLEMLAAATKETDHHWVTRDCHDPCSHPGTGGRQGHQGLDREIDPLGERKLTGIVDGVRGPTHVTPPCVGPRLTTTTCLLLAAESPADLGARRPDVHVADPAVRAVSRNKALGLGQVAGEDARRETLRHIVVDSDRLVEVVVRHHVQDWRKGLTTDDIRLLVDSDDGRRGIEGLGRLILEPASSTSNESATLFGDGPKSVLHDLVCRVVNQRTNEGSARKRVTDREPAIHLGDPVDEIVHDAHVSDDAAHRRASLAGCSGSGEHDPTCGQVEIGGRRHNSRVVAPELQQ